jgi:hypothetical protein
MWNQPDRNAGTALGERTYRGIGREELLLAVCQAERPDVGGGLGYQGNGPGSSHEGVTAEVRHRVDGIDRRPLGVRALDVDGEFLTGSSQETGAIEAVVNDSIVGRGDRDADLNEKSMIGAVLARNVQRVGEVRPSGPVRDDPEIEGGLGLESVVGLDGLQPSSLGAVLREQERTEAAWIVRFVGVCDRQANAAGVARFERDVRSDVTETGRRESRVPGQRERALLGAIGPDVRGYGGDR